MGKLQNNYTTKEQSKRLLELGVPADSADCYLNSDSVIMLNGKTFQENYNEDLELARLHLIEYPHYLPCWSVGRLIEIYVIVRDLDISYLPIERGEDMVKYLIRLYEEKAKDMDFSKMEE